MEKFKLKRVWVEASLHKAATIKITSKEKLHHLTVVLKVRAGEQLRLFNAADGEWLGQVQSKTNKELVIEVKEQLKQASQDSNITIAFAPIKLDRLRFLIEKCTEIGAKEFIPVITERTTLRNLKSVKLDAYALGAAEQSERFSIPVIREPVSLKSFLEQNTTTPILFCSERSNAKFIKDTLRTLPNLGPLIILIGPEGGFTPAEQKAITSNKAVHPISLGHNILRAETAATFALSCAVCEAYADS
jgi:16S rRNA (uracil1498-N3)-methyltransferase